MFEPTPNLPGLGAANRGWPVGTPPTRGGGIRSELGEVARGQTGVNGVAKTSVKYARIRIPFVV